MAEEMHLPDYLNMDPRTARTRAVRMASSIRPTAGQLVEGAE